MTKEEILEYVTHTPENTNRAVLSDMLDEFSSGSGGGNGGVLVVNATYNEGDDNYTLDKTWQEIHDADFAVIIGLTGNVGLKKWVPIQSADELELSIIAYDGAMYDQYAFTATSASGYPVGGSIK